MNDAAKAAKELFVSNNDGTSIVHVLSVLSVVPAAVFLAKIVASICHLRAVTGGEISPAARFGLEYGLIMVPVVAAMTIGSQVAGAITIGMVGSAWIIQSVAQQWAGRQFVSAEAAAPYAGWTFSSGRPPFLTHLRSGVYLLTIIAILAVDFPLFPRVLGKTEVAGYSLMDIGVGAVVLTGAIASKQARAVMSSSVIRVAGSSWSATRSEASRRFGPFLGEAIAGCIGLGGAIQQSLVAVLPLLLLGGGKFVASLLFNYQNHVTEYGRHWNFFLTLAVVPPLVAGVEVVCIMTGFTLSLPDSIHTESPDDEDEVIAADNRGSRHRSTAEVFSRATAMDSVRQPRSAVQAGRQWLQDALPLVLCGLCVSLAQQVWLSWGGFGWIVAAQRAGDGLGEDQWRLGATVWYFVDANREGLTGVVGFAAIALIGVGIGRGIFLPVARHRLLHMEEQHRRAAAGVASAAGHGELFGKFGFERDAEAEAEAEAMAEERFALSAAASWGIVGALTTLSGGLGVLHAVLVKLSVGSALPGARGFDALATSRRTVNTAYVLFTCSAMAGVLALLMIIHLLVVPVPAIARKVRTSTHSGDNNGNAVDVAATITDNDPGEEDEEDTDMREEQVDGGHSVITPARSRGRASSSAARAIPRFTKPLQHTASGDDGPHDRLGAWLALLDAANRHPLMLFLVANVFTGLVNTALGNATSTMPDAWALCILGVYTLACCALVFELDRVGLVVRLL